MNALVVDNNPVLLKAVSTLVEREGCHVVTAENGLQAIEALRRAPVDIVFTDLVMPLISGEQLCTIIRNSENLNGIFIVVISAIPLVEAEQIVETLSCDLCIVKGNLAEMRNNIREALDCFRQRTGPESKILGRRPILPILEENQQCIASEILAEKMHREEIVACLSEGVIELNSQGVVVEINKAALDILECTLAEVIGIDLVALGWGSHTTDIAGWRDRQLRGAVKKTLLIGDDRPIFREGKVLTMTLMAISGTSYFGICILRDITRQHLAEEYRRKVDRALRLVKKMDAMSGMAGGMAHDFNNLLTIMCGNIDIAEMALKHGEIDHAGTKLEEAKNTAQSAVDLIRKISQSSAYGIIDREEHPVESVLPEAVATFADRDAVNITFDFAPGLHGVVIDKEQIISACHNVLLNSLEAEATEVTYTTRQVDFNEPVIVSGQYVPAGRYLRIECADNGKGIATHLISQVFDPYFSTKQRGVAKGMGLGLTVVYSTLRNHGGYVVVESQAGKGTCVSFYLPMASGERERDQNRSQQGTTILLIEPDNQGRSVAAAMLEYLGLAVIQAPTMEKAVVLYREHAEEGNIGGVIIGLDWNHADSGVSLCKTLKTMDPDLPIIATSGSAVSEEMRECRSYGFANALPKPYTLDDLRHVLNSIAVL